MVGGVNYNIKFRKLINFADIKIQANNRILLNLSQILHFLEKGFIYDGQNICTKCFVLQRKLHKSEMKIENLSYSQSKGHTHLSLIITASPHNIARLSNWPKF